MRNAIRNFFRETDGQNMVEYGLVLALVALAAVAMLTGFTGTVSGGYGAIGTKVTDNIK